MENVACRPCSPYLENVSQIKREKLQWEHLRTRTAGLTYMYIYMYISPSFTPIVDFRFFYSFESEIESDSGLLKKIEREDFSFFSRKLLERWTRSVAGLVGVR